MMKQVTQHILYYFIFLFFLFKFALSTNEQFVINRIHIASFAAFFPLVNYDVRPRFRVCFFFSASSPLQLSRVLNKV